MQHLESVVNLCQYLLKDVYVRQNEHRLRETLAVSYNDAGMEMEEDDDENVCWQTTSEGKLKIENVIIKLNDRFTGYALVKDSLDCCIVAYSSAHSQFVESKHPIFGLLCQRFLEIVQWIVDHDEVC